VLVVVAEWVEEEVGHSFMKGLFSRKQFFIEKLRQGLKVLSRRIDGNDESSTNPQADHCLDCDRISSNFPLTLLRQEAQRPGINTATSLFSSNMLGNARPIFDPNWTRFSTRNRAY